MTLEQRDLDFLARCAPKFSGKRYDIPPPSLKPLSRLQRRLAWRNMIHLFPSQSGKLSMYPEQTRFPVYESERYFGDSWDGLQYGRVFDYARAFFEQFANLRDDVPHPMRSVVRLENSDYCNNCAALQNCYLVFNANNCQDSICCESLYNSRDCLECVLVDNSELCFDCVDCSGCYNLQSSRSCHGCRDSFFLWNCRNCTNCYGCANLRRAQYCIFNRQVAPDEFAAFVAQKQLSSYSSRLAAAAEFSRWARSQPFPGASKRLSENCSGNFIGQAKNVYDSFFVVKGENLRFCLGIHDGAANCYDVSYFGVGLEESYECSVCGLNSYHLLFCHDCWEGSAELIYCIGCVNCKDCFGCVGLQRKQFCIFNRQYTKDAYEREAPLIINHMVKTGEWGEFFPASLSPLPYNRTVAQRYFPLDAEAAVKQNLKWHEEVSREAMGIPASGLPDNVPNVSAAIVVRRSLSNLGSFKITPVEIEAYRRFRAPLPREPYHERLNAAMRSLGGVELFETVCAKSGKIILSSVGRELSNQIWDLAEYEKEFGA